MKADARAGAQFARAAVFASTAEAKYSAQFARAAVFASTADARAGEPHSRCRVLFAVLGGMVRDIKGRPFRAIWGCTGCVLNVFHSRCRVLFAEHPPPLLYTPTYFVIPIQIRTHWQRSHVSRACVERKGGCV